MHRFLRERFQRIFHASPSKANSVQTQQAFFAAMEFTHNLARQNPSALVDLIRLLGRKIQMSAIASVTTQYHKPEYLYPETLLFEPNIALTEHGETFSELRHEIAPYTLVNHRPQMALPQLS